MASDVRIWTGTAWQSLKGPEGPSSVSANSNNACRLGTDTLIYVGPASASALGAIKVGTGLTVAADGTLSASGATAATTAPANLAAAAAVGTSAAYARADHVHARPTLTELGAAPTVNPEFTVQVRAPAGNLAAPGISFAAAPASGFYIDGPNSMRVSVNGTQREWFNNDTLYYYVNAFNAEASFPFCPSFTWTNKNNDSNSMFLNMYKVPAAKTMTLPCQLGTIQFAGCDSTGTVKTGGMIQCVATAQTATHVSAQISFHTSSLAGLLEERIRLGSDGTTTVTGNITVQGAVNTFTQSSINSTAIGPLQLKSIGITGTYILLISDACKVLWNTHNGGDSTVLIPTNAVCPFPVGTVVDVLDAATVSTWIQANPGVTLNFTSNHSVDPGVLEGGVGAAGKCRMKGILSTVRLLKIGTDHWYVLGEVSKT